MPAILQNHHVLAVHNVRESARFYVDSLGFEIVAEPAGWIFVAKDNCMIMLGECPNDMHPSELGCHNYFAYLRVDDADAYFALIKEKGVETLGEIADQPWSMREFGVRTPDGHRIMIGQNIKKSATDTRFVPKVTATLSVRNWDSAFDFYKKAFSATELYRVPGGGVGQLSVAGADFWVAEESPEHLNFSPETIGGCSVRMLLMVEDPAGMCEQAVAAGAELVLPVADNHGWRIGRIVDPFGHHWEIARKLVVIDGG